MIPGSWCWDGTNLISRASLVPVAVYNQKGKAWGEGLFLPLVKPLKKKPLMISNNNQLTDLMTVVIIAKHTAEAI